MPLAGHGGNFEEMEEPHETVRSFLFPAPLPGVHKQDPSRAAAGADVQAAWAPLLARCTHPLTPVVWQVRMRRKPVTPQCESKQHPALPPTPSPQHTPAAPGAICA